MQVSSPSHADLMVKLGVNKAVGLILVFLWMAVLVVTIVLRRHTSYEAHKELHWWEGFYRTGSIIFGGGQVCLHSCSHHHSEEVTTDAPGPSLGPDRRAVCHAHVAILCKACACHCIWKKERAYTLGVGRCGRTPPVSLADFCTITISYQMCIQIGSRGMCMCRWCFPCCKTKLWPPAGSLSRTFSLALPWFRPCPVPSSTLLPTLVGPVPPVAFA